MRGQRPVGDTSRERRVQCRVIQLRGNQPLELGDESMDAFRWQIEREELDGNRPVASRIVGEKHRTQSSRTDLMKNTKRSEPGRKPHACCFRVQ